MMSRPRAVIFDIGNVLVGWQPEAFYDRTIGADRRRALFAEVDLHGMNEAIDHGAPFRETVWDWADRHPRWRAEIRLWHDRWTDIASPPIDRSIRLQRALRARGVPVFALSNLGRHTYEYAAPLLPFLRDFDRRYISGCMGVTKPNPRIYAMVEEDCGLPPESLLFTDDRAENIAAAAARGWRTHLFTGPDGLAARLVAEGLLTEEDAAS